jgi:CDP-diacylglycerol--serine O-phosphatidyltransferase
VFDFLDGFAARLFKVTSSIGKELDSLADMVSFGVLPSITMFQWIQSSAQFELIAFIALVIAVFSALRLAKFNIDTRQSDSFIGLPTPANALFITSLIFLPEPVRFWVFTSNVLILISIVFAFLLVAPINLFALKFKSFSFGENQTRYLFLILSLVLILFLKAGALPIIILLYILLSFMSNVFGRKTK